MLLRPLQIKLLQPRWRYAGALIFGALLTFAYAPFSQAWLTPLLLTGFLLMLVRSSSAKQAAWTGFSFGFGWFAAGISWVYVSIDQFGGMPMIASVLVMIILCAYLALFPLLTAWLWFKCRRYCGSLSLFLVPILWLLTEFLRGWLLTGFPWLGLGYTQTLSTLGNFAPHIGEIGIAVALWLMALGFTYMLLQNRFEWLFLPLAIVIVAWLAPRFNPMHYTGEQTSVALVQGNVVQDLKWDAEQQWPNFDTYTELTAPHLQHDLIIWPESAITFIEPLAQRPLAMLDELLLEQETTLISGIIDLDRHTGEFFNSMIVMGEQPQGGWQYGHSNRYQKHQLLPIGEFVPFEALLRPIAPLFNLPMSSFSRGAAVQPNLNANGVLIAANICYEVAFSRQIRANVTTDTQFLLTISNDTWFGDSHGPHQHWQIAVMRARELGRPMLRATNNGITGVIDHTGATLTRLPQFTAGVASTPVLHVEGETGFARFGDLPAWLIAMLASLFAWRREKRKSA